MTLHARQIFRTDERLDARCAYHFSVPDLPVQVAAGAGQIAMIEGVALRVRTFDGELVYEEAIGEMPDRLQYLDGDRLLIVTSQGLSLRSAEGVALFELAAEDVEHVAVCSAGERVAFVHEETWLVIHALDDGREIGRWDMAEDYDFGRGAVQSLALHADRVFVLHPREITEWVDGGLERMIYRGGDNVPRWGTSSLSWVGACLVEACGEERGLVAYESERLDFLRQWPVEVDDAHAVQGEVVGWSEACIVSWDPATGVGRIRQADWAAHTLQCVAADGRHAASLSPGGEICVFEVGGLPTLDALPEAAISPPAVGYAVLAPGGDALVYAETDGEGLRMRVVDREGNLRTFAEVIPTSYLTAFVGVDPHTVATVDDTDDTTLRLWRLDDLSVTEHAVPGFFDIGTDWLRVRPDDEREALVCYGLPDLGEGVEHVLPPELTIVDPLPHPLRIVASDGENEVLYDFDDGVILQADSGHLAGRLYLVEGWNDDYDTVMTLWDLTDGESQEFLVETSATWVSARQDAAYFDDYDGAMFVWRAKQEPRKFAELPDSHDFRLSADERWLTCREGGDVLLFDAADPGEPVARIPLPFRPDFVHCDGSFLIAGSPGATVVFTLE